MKKNGVSCSWNVTAAACALLRRECGSFPLRGNCVATHWMPKIIKEFQKDYPGIDYEMLLGDYTEIRSWIAEGRVDCGFLCLPTDLQFEVEELEKDELMAVIPKNHSLIKRKKFPIEALEEEPFKPLEKPVFRKIGVAMKSKKTASAVTKKFLEYLKYRS